MSNHRGAFFCTANHKDLCECFVSIIVKLYVVLLRMLTATVDGPASATVGLVLLAALFAGLRPAKNSENC